MPIKFRALIIKAVRDFMADYKAYGTVVDRRFVINGRQIKLILGNCSHVISSVTRDLLALAFCHPSAIHRYARDDVRSEQLRF